MSIFASFVHACISYWESGGLLSPISPKPRAAEAWTTPGTTPKGALGDNGGPESYRAPTTSRSGATPIPAQAGVHVGDKQAELQRGQEQPRGGKGKTYKSISRGGGQGATSQARQGGELEGPVGAVVMVDRAMDMVFAALENPGDDPVSEFERHYWCL